MRRAVQHQVRRRRRLEGQHTVSPEHIADRPPGIIPPPAAHIRSGIFEPGIDLPRLLLRHIQRQVIGLAGPRWRKLRRHLTERIAVQAAQVARQFASLHHRARRQAQPPRHLRPGLATAGRHCPQRKIHHVEPQSTRPGIPAGPSHHLRPPILRQARRQRTLDLADQRRGDRLTDKRPPRPFQIAGVDPGNIDPTQRGPHRRHIHPRPRLNADQRSRRPPHRHFGRIVFGDRRRHRAPTDQKRNQKRQADAARHQHPAPYLPCLDRHGRIPLAALTTNVRRSPVSSCRTAPPPTNSFIRRVTRKPTKFRFFGKPYTQHPTPVPPLTNPPNSAAQPPRAKRIHRSPTSRTVSVATSQKAAEHPRTL